VTRRHLFELEDQPWLPRVWRDGATDVLDVLFATAGAARPLALALHAFMTAAGQRRWFDLGSGSGGGALAMRAELMALGGGPDAITFTDRYPNEAARRRVASLQDPALHYLAEPVDALEPLRHPPALRTMFGALHHFPPELVRRIVQDAVAARTPLAFVDVAASPAVRRLPAALVPLAAVPNLLFPMLLVLILVPRVRPFRWSLLLWTYLVPAIPVIFAWDGTVSALRAYTPDELLALAASVPGAGDYDWNAIQAGRSLMLTGRPIRPASGRA
jgi:hypothetical protein